MNPQHSEARRRKTALIIVGVAMVAIVILSAAWLGRRRSLLSSMGAIHDLPPTGGAASAFTEAAGPSSQKAHWSLRNLSPLPPPPAAPEHSIRLAVEPPSAPFALGSSDLHPPATGSGLTSGGNFGVVDWARLFAANQQTNAAENELASLKASITERMNDLQEGGFAAEADQVRNEGQRQLSEHSKQARERISSEIQAAVGRVAERHGFAVVLDSSAQSLNSVPVLLAHRTYADVTDEVERELRIGQRR